MDILQTLYVNLIPFILILSLLVFVHELGHYLVAKWNGVKVEVFSIGFGREILGWTDRSGTRWKISWLPLGGYVRMFSDLNAASQPDTKTIKEMSDEEKKMSLFHKTVWQRIAVSAAGPLANYLFAILIFGIIYIVSGQRMPSTEAKIGFIMPSSPAAEAGLKVGDKVLSVNDKNVTTFSELHDIIVKSPDVQLHLKIDRLGENLTISVKPTVVEIKDQKIGRLGIQQGFDQVKRPFYSAFGYALHDVIHVSYATLESVGRIIVRKQSADGLSGPIGIATTIGEVAQKNWIDLIWLTAFLSLNLGLINLFPVPMLDGGHLLFYFIEAVRGKPLSEKAQEIGFRIGFALLMGLVLLTTWNDLSRFKFFMYIKNLFN
ncbi:RIP metalloprotease RseP [Candidatus Nucleicultrix amoebiphila]|jgi:regulator of sigma E protease|uniref:Zinc metalloprotease n=1 Tax=Candidatus Nucleicultrix amoebiphila FS5 TaxID=1414854 RepID=A0A1W6N2X6_9PROT|nr:RIP metalloprotease RseP [Candidatus Nucleicultrix amoebiphila]ARN84205.1 hypothetical protein GQ61_01335 [Candidatus Nucleicultrix amoebiphila FS5]